MIRVKLLESSDELFGNSCAPCNRSGLNPDIPIFSSLVYCQSNALDHAAPEANPHRNFRGPQTSLQTSSNSQTANNDGLTKQQLDLIHQIMQQTQQQAAAQQKQHQQSTSVKTGSSNSKATTATSKARSWTVQGGVETIRRYMLKKEMDINVLSRSVSVNIVTDNKFSGLGFDSGCSDPSFN
uniref:Uncharacterized protein n=1 Tax=Timema shepardi TaxID=629360 RepID=A0A7R9AMI0_TIMSH|nr:unnamed protein product [Timema shepardi]